MAGERLRQSVIVLWLLVGAAVCNFLLVLELVVVGDGCGCGSGCGRTVVLLEQG